MTTHDKFNSNIDYAKLILETPEKEFVYNLLHQRQAKIDKYELAEYVISNAELYKQWKEKYESTPSYQLTHYLVYKPNGDRYEVLLLPYKNTNLWSFINLTKQHICSCKFTSKADALRDMENRKACGLITDYIEYTL